MMGLSQPQKRTGRNCKHQMFLSVLCAGDGRLGLLIAQVLALKAPGRVTHFGRHADKMALVSGSAAQVLVTDATAAEHAGSYNLVVEASGTNQLVDQHVVSIDRHHGLLLCQQHFAISAL
jgi:threonine dehydrogenase-like Zn-dependent dehydrogenase